MFDGDGDAADPPPPPPQQLQQPQQQQPGPPSSLAYNDAQVMQVAVHSVQPTYGSADSLPTRDEWRELLDAKPDVKTALTDDSYDVLVEVRWKLVGSCARFNKLGPDGGKAFAEVLETNTSLEQRVRHTGRQLFQPAHNNNNNPTDRLGAGCCRCAGRQECPNRCLSEHGVLVYLPADSSLDRRQQYRLQRF
eukprot:gene8267-4339_t